MIVPLAGVVVGALGSSAWALNRMALATLRPPVRPVQRTPSDAGLVHEEVEFSSGGLTLRGWWIEGSPRAEAPAAVLVHGWAANAGRMMPVAEALVAAGVSVLAFDVRGHGRSDAASVVTLRHYRDDVQAALRFLAERRPGGRTVLVGHSMGGAAAILATADGHPVGALALLAAPADLLEVTQGWMRDNGVPGHFAVPLLLPFWRLQTGEPWSRLRPEERIAEVSVPTLIVQGGADRRVPPIHADRLAERREVPITRVEDADHMGLLEREVTHRALLSLIRGLEGSTA
ncbi:MAG: alpha/beta fold hydrolase [Gemmatimonadota bacterium]